MKLSNDSSAYLCHLRCTKKAEGRWEPCDKDPSSWLYLNPQPVTEGTSFGVLRKTFWGRVNSGHEFGWRKTHLGPDFAGSDQSVWAPNAERVEVVLPAKADDLLSDPCELLRQTDKFAAPNKQALLTYWTMPLGTAERLHIAWECVRSFARLIACNVTLAALSRCIVQVSSERIFRSMLTSSSSRVSWDGGLSTDPMIKRLFVTTGRRSLAGYGRAIAMAKAFPKR